jgi:hypothetical protein
MLKTYDLLFDPTRQKLGTRIVDTMESKGKHGANEERQRYVAPSSHRFDAKAKRVSVSTQVNESTPISPIWTAAI